MTKEYPPDPALDDSTLEGNVFKPTNDEERNAAIETAFDYRGDITILTANGESYEGYIFDRDRKVTPHTLRLMLSHDGSKQTLTYDQVAELRFTGRDAAAGKSWETWIRKYAEKLAQGEKAQLEPESLD